jgi:hypothetical protein
MSRVSGRTTVDEDLLSGLGPADPVRPTPPCSTRRLVGPRSNPEIDAMYPAYDEHPLDEPDDWGDLSSFREAAAAS